MSNIQWLGIWGMTGFSKPEDKDLNKWTKGIAYVLGDPKGQHYFKEFLSRPGCDFEKHAQILELWVRCDALINQESVNQSEAQEIFNKARQYLRMTPRVVSPLQVVSESQNEAQIKEEVKKVQEVASDNLIDVYNTFTDSLQTSRSQKKLKCVIL